MKKDGLLKKIEDLVKATGVSTISGKAVYCRKYNLENLHKIPIRSRRSVLSDLKLFYKRLHGVPYRA